MNTTLKASNFSPAYVRSCAAQAQPFRPKGQGTLGKSFPCLRTVFADSVSWANAKKTFWIILLQLLCFV